MVGADRTADDPGLARTEPAPGSGGFVDFHRPRRRPPSGAMNAVISYRNPAPISPSADRVAVRNQSHRIRRSAVTVCLFTFSSVSFIIPSLTCSASGNLGPPAHLIIIKVCLVCLLFGLRCRPCGQRLSSIAKRIQMFRKAATDGEIRCGRCCCCSRFFSLSLFFLLGLFLFFFTFWLRPFGTLSALFIVAFDWIVFETVNGRRRRRLLARPSFFTRRNIEPFTVLLAFTGWLFYFLFFFSCSSTDFSPPWRVVYRVSTGFYWIFFEGGGFALLCFDFDSNWRRFFFSQSRPRIKHSAGGRSANKIGSSIKKSDPGRHRRAEDVQKKNENQKQKPKKKKHTTLGSQSPATTSTTTTATTTTTKKCTLASFSPKTSVLPQLSVFFTFLFFD